ncbi:MAG: prolyl oligopeptidase family serine peptidase [Stappiaceae bacterium]
MKLSFLTTPLGVALVWLAINTSAHACGPDTDCQIGDRYYRIRMPEGHDGVTRVGAIVFAHGYKGSAKGTMRNKSLAKVASELGVAFIATKSAGPDWSIPGAPSQSVIAGADELAYFDRVIEDAEKRFPIDRERLMATGFSAGGMMVWNLACHRPESFAAFLPMAGTFWEPVPETCEKPVADIMHFHGDADKIVPQSGRNIADTRQGSVPDALKMYAEFGEFGPAQKMTMADMVCEEQTSPEGSLLRFCEFSGGHSFRSNYVKAAWQDFEKAGSFGD